MAPDPAPTRALSEYDSKLFLAAHGLPVTRERLATSLGEAREAASQLGYPLAMKASGADYAHKTELGLVELDIRDEKDLELAHQRLLQRAPTLGQVLVQQMVRGQRELVAGLSRDPQYGPCVMFGLGGIFTEVLRDVVFRVAPLAIGDALDMLEEMRASRILGAVRGLPAVDRRALAEILVSLGRIGLEHPQVAEVDINPLKILPDGRPVAVDALVVLYQEG